jgi:hypothetical protein
VRFSRTAGWSLRRIWLTIRRAWLSH